MCLNPIFDARFEIPKVLTAAFGRPIRKLRNSVLDVCTRLYLNLYG